MSMVETQQIKPINKTCSNKHCPQGLFNESKNGVQQLCPVCTDRYKQDYYCIYCHQVYFESTDDGKNWIECEECKGWVHEVCADVVVSRNGPDTGNISFKCIKCKKIQNVPTKRTNNNRAQPKPNKKNQSSTFYNIGFSWALKSEQIAEDVKKLQAYLRDNNIV